MIIALALSFSMAGAAVPSAGTPPSPSAAPAGLDLSAAEAPIEFSPGTLDLGELIAGTIGTGTVKVTNCGTAAIRVKEIKPACGCTTVSAPPKDSIAPGASFDVSLSIDPGKKTGVSFSKKVAFILDDGSTRSLTIRGSVKAYVAMTPALIEGSEIPTHAHAVLSLESRDGVAFSMIGIEPAGLEMAAPREPSLAHRVSIDWDSWRRVGRPEQIILRTDHPHAPSIAVPVRLAPTVASLRIPVARDDADAASQDAIIHEVDRVLRGRTLSDEFAVKLHRETGLLFVHGTPEEVTLVRTAVTRAMPASAARRR